MRIINAGNRIMNTYVYKAPCGYVMIDTGYANSLKNVTKKLEKAGISLNDIKYVFLTHAHDDHAGFLNELLHKQPDLKVIASDRAKSVLKRGQNSFDGGCSNFLAFAFCKVMALFGKGEHRFPRIEDRFDDRFVEVNDGSKAEAETLLGGEILITPGHTPDSVSLKLDDIVFCGDAAMNGLPSVERITIWVGDKTAYEASWDVLLRSNAETVYPAHGKPFGVKDLTKYKSRISRRKLYSLK